MCGKANASTCFAINTAYLVYMHKAKSNTDVCCTASTHSTTLTLPVLALSWETSSPREDRLLLWKETLLCHPRWHTLDLSVKTRICCCDFAGILAATRSPHCLSACFRAWASLTYCEFFVAAESCMWLCTHWRLCLRVSAFSWVTTVPVDWLTFEPPACLTYLDRYTPVWLVIHNKPWHTIAFCQHYADQCCTLKKSKVCHGSQVTSMRQPQHHSHIACAYAGIFRATRSQHCLSACSKAWASFEYC